MYEQIKQIADEAIKVQNKDKMDAALREISGLCGKPDRPETVPRGTPASFDTENLRLQAAVKPKVIALDNKPAKDTDETKKAK